MAGLSGLAGGFLQGYQTVANVQDQRKRTKLAQRRQQQREAYRQQRLEQARQQAKYQRSRNQVQDEHWQQKFALDKQQARNTQSRQQDRLDLAQQKLALQKANQAQDNARADARLGMARQQAKAKQRANEIELARTARQAREKQNRRYLAAATQELQANGVTDRFVDLAQQGGINPQKFVDDDYNENLDILKAGMQGAPIRHSKMVNAADTVFRDNVDRVIGGKTPNGNKIVRANINNVYPSNDGQTTMVDLNVWAKDDEGNVHKYQAPATSNRSADDDYVLQIPTAKIADKVASLDAARRSINQQQLASVINQRQTLLGGGPSQDSSGSDDYWIRGPGNTIVNRATGESKKVPTVKDVNERYAKATDRAQDDMEAARKVAPYKFNKMGSQAIQQWLLDRRNVYLNSMTPNDQSIDVDDAVKEKIKANGGRLEIPDTAQQYAGKTLVLGDDGSVSVR